MFQNQVRRLLVYRLGSIGDFVIALPCLHLLRARYPKAEIVLLTNSPVENRAAPGMSVLDGTKLVDRYFTYTIGLRTLHATKELVQTIRKSKPDLLVYLVERRTFYPVYRDYLFFRWCGITRTVGFPFTRDLLTCRPPSTGAGLWEPEAGRLGRCLAALGTVDAGQAENWDLQLSDEELAEADRLVDDGIPGASRGLRLLGLSVGTKQAINDWGDANWRAALVGLTRRDRGLVLIGASEDWARSEEIARQWSGPVLNLCGRMSPRLSAAVIRRTERFLCHDSGPMHLAAAVGTRCVAVFSNKDPPGKWFPFGPGHVVIRPPAATDAIQAIRPPDMIAAVSDWLVDSCPRNATFSTT